MQTATQPDRLNQLLQFLLDTAQETKSFAVAEMPLVAQEIISWGL
jgi:hypothetical protein